MSYYFLIPFLALCILADFIIIRYGLLDEVKPEKRRIIILIILNTPLLWLLMKLDNSFHPLVNLFSISDRTFIGFTIKVPLAVVLILFLEVVLYGLIKAIAGKKLSSIPNRPGKINYLPDHYIIEDAISL
ncbi:MAG TPA: hypothetical protein VFP87_06195 [Chitinophagaceae bacterium]|nr:hypothetical protein [Chitinophagaceae bacterium]